jgi:predicted Fe-S protein YdhL (DUF1289 family)
MPTDPSTLASQATPLSPCIRVCTLDDDRVCVGCGRHVDEISAWTLMSGQEQRAVLARSEERRRLRNKSIEEVSGYGR